MIKVNVSVHTHGLALCDMCVLALHHLRLFGGSRVRTRAHTHSHSHFVLAFSYIVVYIRHIPNYYEYYCYFQLQKVYKSNRKISK